MKDQSIWQRLSALEQRVTQLECDLAFERDRNARMQAKLDERDGYDRTGWPWTQQSRRGRLDRNRTAK